MPDVLFLGQCINIHRTQALHNSFMELYLHYLRLLRATTRRKSCWKRLVTVNLQLPETVALVAVDIQSYAYSFELLCCGRLRTMILQCASHNCGSCTMQRR
jgi:hypothetical protein